MHGHNPICNKIHLDGTPPEQTYVLQAGPYEVSGRSHGGVLTNEREEN